MPPLPILKKRRAEEEVPALRDEKERLQKDENWARKKLKAHGSFSAATEVESMVLKKTRIICEISLAEFDGEPSEWQQTQEARRLLEQIRAQEHRVASFTSQGEVLSLDRPKRSMRETFMKLFTTSPLIGLGIKTGAGKKRDGSKQSNFRAQLMNDYQSLDETGYYAWCPILQKHISSTRVTASQLFSWKHGQATMDTIFGKISPPELFSSRNGLIICSEIVRGIL